MTADGYLVMTAVGTDVACRPIIGKSLSPWLPLRQSASRPPTIIVYLQRWERFLQCNILLLLLFVLQGRSKRSSWSGHGRQIVFFFFFIKNFGGIIIEPGIFSILFLKQRRHSRQNVHSDFRPFPSMPLRAGSHHHSMGGKDPHVHDFVGLYSDQIEPISEQVSQTVLQVSQTVLQVLQTVLRLSWQHEWTENVCC